MCGEKEADLGRFFGRIGRWDEATPYGGFL